MSLKAVHAHLNYPNGIFVSPTNEVFIVDSGNCRIRKILRNGDIVTIAGTGEQGFSGDKGLATHAKLCNPSSVFVSSTNEVTIADTDNHRIRKILRDGTIETIAGNGFSGYDTDSIIATNATLTSPSSVFVTLNNEIVFADCGNCIVKKVSANGTIATIAGNGLANFGGDNGLATHALIQPFSVFVSSKNDIYISDSCNSRIRKVHNQIITTIAGIGTQAGPSGDGGLASKTKLKFPTGCFVTQNNEVFIADYLDNRIRKILRDGTITTIAGNGEAGYNGDGILAINAQLNKPSEVFVSSNNEIYIADTGNHRIRKVLTNGNIVTIAGTGEAEYNGDSPFDISLCPHIGGIYYSTLFTKSQIPYQLFDMTIGFHIE